MRMDHQLELVEVVRLHITPGNFALIIAAVVIGCCLYDIALTTLEWSWKGTKNLARDARDWFADKRLERRSRPARAKISERIRRLVGESPDVSPGFVPEVPDPPTWRWLVNPTTKALHELECHRSHGCDIWPWATTENEAIHYAREQGLKTGCSCVRGLFQQAVNDG